MEEFRRSNTTGTDSRHRTTEYNVDKIIRLGSQSPLPCGSPPLTSGDEFPSGTRLKTGALVAEPTLQDGELVTQRENFDVPVVVAHRDQSQGGEGVSDGNAGQAYEHEQ
ncbi:hypothetical protein [Streptomyces aureus]|uniref:hypothetical protein n=1 Tax=Streptomyces aureus TaxID=193461 RepID=UPI0031D06949